MKAAFDGGDTQDDKSPPSETLFGMFLVRPFRSGPPSSLFFTLSPPRLAVETDSDNCASPMIQLTCAGGGNGGLMTTQDRAEVCNVNPNTVVAWDWASETPRLLATTLATLKGHKDLQKRLRHAVHVGELLRQGANRLSMRADGLLRATRLCLQCGAAVSMKELEKHIATSCTAVTREGNGRNSRGEGPKAKKMKKTEFIVTGQMAEMVDGEQQDGLAGAMPDDLAAASSPVRAGAGGAGEGGGAPPVAAGTRTVDLPVVAIPPEDSSNQAKYCHSKTQSQDSDRSREIPSICSESGCGLSKDIVPQDNATRQQHETATALESTRLTITGTKGNSSQAEVSDDLRVDVQSSASAMMTLSDGKDDLAAAYGRLANAPVVHLSEGEGAGEGAGAGECRAGTVSSHYETSELEAAIAAHDAPPTGSYAAVQPSALMTPGLTTKESTEIPKPSIASTGDGAMLLNAVRPPLQCLSDGPA